MVQQREYLFDIQLSVSSFDDILTVRAEFPWRRELVADLIKAS